MKKILINVLLSLAAAIAIGLLAYPYISFWLAEKNQTVVIQEYNQHIGELDQEKKQNAWDSAVEYNSHLYSSVPIDPFSKGISIQDEEYSSLLNLKDDGMMGHLKIPRIQVDIPVFHGTSENVLQMGVGHLKGTALPVGGEGTHAVLTGHTGLTNSKMFSDLEKLLVGDEFYLYILGEVLAYRIDRIDVVLPNETERLMPVAGHDYATLITCTPYGINTHRLLLRGERVPYTPEEIDWRLEQTKAVIGRETMILLAGCSLLALWIIFNIILVSKRRYQQKENKKRFQHI